VQRREEDVLREEHARREALTTDTLLRKIEPLPESLSRRKSKIDLSKIQQGNYLSMINPFFFPRWRAFSIEDK
jgi:hypothetical protein